MKNDEELMLLVERRFIRFMVNTIMGIRRDYYRKQFLKNKNETIFCDVSDEIIEGIETVDSLGLDNAVLLEALKYLTNRQKEVIIKVIIEDKTEASVAKELRISQQTVHAAKKQAINKLKNYLKGQRE